MAIPKEIHYCWLGGNPKPESVLKCIESWKKYCPDYEIREWNETNLEISSNEYTSQAYEAKAWGFVPDYLRLWIVYNFGGIYLDTDVQVLKSFDDLLDCSAFIGFERGTNDKSGYYVNCGQGFGAEAGNIFLKRHMELYNDISFKLADGTYNRLASPHYTTAILEKEGLDRKRNVTQRLENVIVFSDDYFCPKSFSTGLIKKSKNTHSIHQFDGSWFSEDEQLLRKQWEKDARIDYIKHIPHRFLRKCVGNEVYAALKRLFHR